MPEFMKEWIDRLTYNQLTELMNCGMSDDKLGSDIADACIDRLETYGSNNEGSKPVKILD